MEMFKLLVALEKQLHSSEVRNSKDKLDILLSEDFREIGASGKLFIKEETIEHLLKSKSSKIEANEFKLNKLSPDIMQLIYREESKLSAVNNRHTLRSSLWKKNGNNWQMLFHQGTVVIECK